MKNYTQKEMVEILLSEGEEITLRTIRYYAQEGTLPERELIDGKLVYTDKHLNHLRAILTMKKTGKKLENIKNSLSSVTEDAISNFSSNHYHYLQDFSQNILDRTIEKVNDDIHITFSNKIDAQEKIEIVTHVLEMYKKNRGIK